MASPYKIFHSSPYQNHRPQSIQDNTTYSKPIFHFVFHNQSYIQRLIHSARSFIHPIPLPIRQQVSFTPHPPTRPKHHHQKLYITPHPAASHAALAPHKMPNYLISSASYAKSLGPSYVLSSANPMLPSIDTVSLYHDPSGFTTLLNLDTSLTTIGAADFSALVPIGRGVVSVALVVLVGVGVYRAVPKIKRFASARALFGEHFSNSSPSELIRPSYL